MKKNEKLLEEILKEKYVKLNNEEELVLLERLFIDTEPEQLVINCYAITDYINTSYSYGIGNFCHAIRLGSYKSLDILYRVALIMKLLLNESERTIYYGARHSDLKTRPLGSHYLLDVMEEESVSMCSLEECFKLIHPFSQQEVYELVVTLNARFDELDVPDIEEFD